MMKKAFTMIELVFVIVVLGILAGVAIPRLAVTRDDATVTKLRAEVQAIRSGISLAKNQNLMRGSTAMPDLGTGFSNVLDYEISKKSSGSGWRDIPTGIPTAAAPITGYKLCIRDGQCANFEYRTTGFVCTDPENTCKLLTGN
ncbi:MAG: type II secretion system GspH family protein [Campylobacter sp.]|nr:type II secretion system GspH family protein [Campylobacter sp.]